jgi:hypothetical protein
VRFNLSRAEEMGETTISWDLNVDRPRITDSDPNQLKVLHSNAAHLAHLVEKSCVEIDLPPKHWHPTFAQYAEVLHDADWLRGVAIAKDRDIAFVSDDLVLRTIARFHGVQTFGTYALVEAQRQINDVSDLQHLSRLDSLVRVGLLDLPDSLDRAARLAFHEHLRPGTSTRLLARPATWSDPLAAYRLFAAVRDPLIDERRFTDLAAWTAAAALGSTLRMNVVERGSLIATLFLATMMHADLDGVPVREFVASARSIVRATGLNPETYDPLREMVLHMRRDLFDDESLKQVPGELRTAMILRTFGELPEEDQAIVLSTLVSSS